MLKISELLKDPKRHTKGHYARNAKNRPVRPESDQAVKWCLVGAISHCYPDDVSSIAGRLRAALEFQGYHKMDVVEWNDDPGTTHQMVLDLAKLADV